MRRLTKLTHLWTVLCWVTASGSLAVYGPLAKDLLEAARIRGSVHPGLVTSQTGHLVQVAGLLARDGLVEVQTVSFRNHCHHLNHPRQPFQYH